MNKLRYTLFALIATLHISHNPLQTSQDDNKGNPIQKVLQTAAIASSLYISNHILPQHKPNPNDLEPGQQRQNNIQPDQEGKDNISLSQQPFQNNTNERSINTTRGTQTLQNSNVAINPLIAHNRQILIENDYMFNMLKKTIKDSIQKDETIENQENLIDSLGRIIWNQAIKLKNLERRTVLQQSVIATQDNEIQVYLQLNRQNQMRIDQQSQLIQRQIQENDQLSYQLTKVLKKVETLKNQTN